MCYKSLLLSARPELQKMLDRLDASDRNNEDLIRILKGLDYELSKASRISIERFRLHIEEGGYGLKPGAGLCLTSDGDLVRYTDHLVLLAIALGEQQ